MTELSTISQQHVTSIPAAMKALDLLATEVLARKTYEELNKLVTAAKAIKLLHQDIEVVKQRAEDVILAAMRKIAEELDKVPKAGGPGRGKTSPTGGKSLSGKAATGIKPQMRSRLGKLVKASTDEIAVVTTRLRKAGKDASPHAVIRELTQGDKQERRTERERELADKITALPTKQYGVIYADPEWRFEPWSRKTGLDRSAENHYPTSVTEVIAERPVEMIAAKTCVLFLWATAPMLPEALEVLIAWGFDYKTHLVWRKQRSGRGRGTGYWVTGEHELLLIGTRGQVPAPATAMAPSVIEAPVGKHSEKPELFAELIEKQFPNLPKIELNRRGPARSGWDAWGTEAADDQV